MRKILLQAEYITRNKEDAQDLLQDTLLALLERKDHYNDINFSGWCYIHLQHIYLNQLRRQKHNIFISDTSFVEIPDTSFKGLKIDIESAIDNLSPTYTTTMLLYLEGYSYEEIALQQKTSIGTVKSRISRARNQLQTILKDYK